MNDQDKTILFVDDEKLVLEALRRMLSPRRKQWRLIFATSGAEALEKLADTRVDIIVSDMRMPGMDGVQLLNEVKEHYPDVVRIILSGQSDREAILKSVGSTHQYLSKPCDSGLLLKTINNALALKETLNDSALLNLISQLDSLPSPPALYQKLLGVLSSTQTSLKRIGTIISRDAGMSAKILQLVNSSFFGLLNKVSSPELAASLLGLDTIKALVLQINIFSSLNRNTQEQFTLDRLWQHCLTTATFARKIAEYENFTPDALDEAYIGGLLHDTGKIILVSKFPTKYSTVRSMEFLEQVPSYQAEIEVFGTSHATVGAYLLGLWGLPGTIVQTVALHHTPEHAPIREFNSLAVVHAADAIEQALAPPEPGTVLSEMNLEYLTELGVAEQVAQWEEVCRATVIEEVEDI